MSKLRISNAYVSASDRPSQTDRQAVRAPRSAAVELIEDSPDSVRLRSSDEDPPIEWTVDEIVRLHGWLLEDCGKIADPKTPMDEVLEILLWMFTEPEKDGRPFSFATCLRLTGQSIRPDVLSGVN